MNATWGGVFISKDRFPSRGYRLRHHWNANKQRRGVKMVTSAVARPRNNVVENSRKPFKTVICSEPVFLASIWEGEKTLSSLIASNGCYYWTFVHNESSQPLWSYSFSRSRALAFINGTHFFRLVKRLFLRWRQAIAAWSRNRGFVFFCSCKVNI